MCAPGFLHGCFGDHAGGVGGGHCGMAADAISWMLGVLGGVKAVNSVGACAQQVAALLATRRGLASEDSASGSGSSSSSAPAPFEGLLIVDRTIDLVSPLCSQLTYGGLVDETWGGDCDLGTAQFGHDITDAAQEGRKVRVPLYRGTGEPDAVYDEVCDLNFAEVRPLQSCEVVCW